ncbi:MAG: 30S ribosomal protein S9 [Chitinophagaceae bacterium]
MEKQKKAIGRRKEAVARIYLEKGNGTITVNDRDYKLYFPLMYLQNQVELPLKTVDGLDKYNATINVVGGGLKGQAEAIKLGLSRALCNLDVEMRTMLKPAGLLTRDPRSVERKKFGHKKARKSYQFSKR